MISFVTTLLNQLFRRGTQINNLQMTNAVWFPETIFNLKTNNPDPDENYAIVVLNRPIKLNPIFTINLWNKARIRTLVDGGANHWLQFKEKTNAELKHPDLITGDFDSITPSTLEHIRNMGAIVKHTDDQNETDFTKSLLELNENYINKHNIGYVIVLLDTSGRIDHLLSHINTLYKAHNFLKNVNVFILAKNSISWLLAAGHHTFHIPKNLVEQEIWCSYVPIGHECYVSTTGFKWNLENKLVKFGGMVSTSNTYKSELLTIDTNGFLYWSMGFDTNED